MNLPPATWRLLHTPPAPGAWNMALDEAILEAAGQGLVPPTLRLYAWEPASLSLGYSQPCADADQNALAQHGWDLVRRPTGGRAILHTDELTYSVSAPPTEPRVAGSVLESYQRLAQALLQALHRLAVPAETEEKYALPDDANPKGPVCFEVPSNWEITVDGKKLIGSAQVRRQIGVLQHGSLPLHGDLTRITQALAFPDEPARADAASRLLARATTVETALGRPVTWAQAADALAASFAQTLNLTLEKAEVTPAETARAEVLLREKYTHPAWTARI